MRMKIIAAHATSALALIGLIALLAAPVSAQNWHQHRHRHPVWHHYPVWHPGPGWTHHSWAWYEHHSWAWRHAHPYHGSPGLGVYLHL